MYTGSSSDTIVEAGWQAVRSDRRVPTELLDAAHGEPRLRQLFPWTGMGELHFSRCAEKRWTWDIPYIRPAAGGGYRILGPLPHRDMEGARHHPGRTARPSPLPPRTPSGAAGRAGPVLASPRPEQDDQLADAGQVLRLLRPQQPSLARSEWRTDRWPMRWEGTEERPRNEWRVAATDTPQDLR
ncbi:DUF6193 family natural product biosynthesis protein [Streptomyces luteireticuli]|uniref:DUF6193 family natural product biosynthesis protein n=1 Tax=Streptomyces luteireticuli TaxID=173858 RepID=UPI003558DA08